MCLQNPAVKRGNRTYHPFEMQFLNRLDITDPNSLIFRLHCLSPMMMSTLQEKEILQLHPSHLHPSRPAARFPPHRNFHCPPHRGRKTGIAAVNMAAQVTMDTEPETGATRRRENWK